MKRLIWTHDAWDDYLSWSRDKRMTRRIQDLIKDIMRSPHEGLGRPELLRGELSGFASRRIDEEHRLVYRVLHDDIEILSCRGHYDK